MAQFQPGLLRIEAAAIDDTLVQGLQMAVADPAWMLARQVQFGELQGHDAGSPVRAVLQREIGTLNALRCGAPDAGTPVLATDLSVAPLEAIVEHEPNAPIGSTRRGLLGLRYRRLVRAHLPANAASAAAVTAYLDGLPAAYPLELGTAIDPLSSGLAIGWAVDGTVLAHDLRAYLADPAGEPLRPPIPAGNADALAAVRAAATDFVAVAAADISSVGSWVAARSEYQVTIAGPTADGEFGLTATEYDSGHLDWYAFDVATDSLHPPVALPRAEVVTLLPSAVIFPGMPAPRLWTIEDAAANFDGLSAAPEDVAAMLVLEFALSYSDEFFLVPLLAEVGTFTRVTSLTVADSFGIDTAVPPADGVRLFRHTPPDESAVARQPPYCVHFPVALDERTADPVELVDLLRDELGDRAWAVERLVADASGARLDLDSAAAQQRVEPGSPATAGQRRYRLRTDVPGNWRPLQPDAAGLAFSLAELSGQGAPLGDFLAGLAETTLAAEEVTRAGARLSRGRRYARGADGSQVLWWGRRVTSPPPAPSVRLGFDVLEPPNT